MQRSSIYQIAYGWFTALLLIFAGSGVVLSLLASFDTASAAASESPFATTTSCVGNLLTNPSFEDGVTGWSKTSGDTLDSMTSYVVDGSYAAYLHRATGNPARAWQQVNLGSNVAGQTFSLSFYSGTHKPSYSHYAILDFYNANGTYISSSSSVEVNRDVDISPYTLQQYTISGIAPANTYQVRVTFAASGDYMKLDGACLTKPNSPTATPTSTNTSVPPTATATKTNTPVPPTATPTNTNTPVPPTATATKTPQPKYAALGNQVWYDLNKNGIQDSEPYASNVRVELLLGCTGNTVLQTLVTDGNGYYLFTGLDSGQYRVRFSNLPAGYQFTAKDQGSLDTHDSDADLLTGISHCVTLATSEKNETVDAGIVSVPPTATATKTNTPVPPTATATKTNTPVPPTATATKTNTPVPPTATATKTNTPVPPTATATKTPQPKYAALGNQVWYDLNKNGIQDSEPFVPNVTVELLLGCTGNTVLQTLVTDGNGYYLFTGLDSGQYRVRFSNLPAGYQFTAKDQGSLDTHDSDADLLTGISHCVTLATSEKNETVDAGIVSVPPTATPTNTNTPVPPTATPTKTNTPVPPTATATKTNTPVPPTATATKTNTPVPPTATATNTNTPVPPTATPTNTPVVLGSLGNQVWFDLNGNGIQDDGNNFVASVTVELFQGCVGNNVLATQVTDVNGIYTFNNLPAGEYRVYFSNLPAGYQFTSKDQGSIEQTDSDAGVDGFTQCVTLAIGEHNPDVDAGIVKVVVPTPTATPTSAPLLASLGDRVWEDSNKNGVQDEKEVGVRNVTVELLDANGNVIATDVTDANGNYLFSQLQPGNYQVRFSKPANYISTQPNQGGNDAMDSDADTVTLQTEMTELVAGENDLSWDYGIYREGDIKPPHLPASIGNLVWQDFDQNGVQDAGETGIADVTVNLYSGQGALITSTVTDENGVYWFHQLAPGDYIVEFVPHAGFMMTKDNVGDDTTDSDVTISNSRTGVITLAEGEINPTIDAGIVPIPTANEQTDEPVSAFIFLPLVTR